MKAALAAGMATKREALMPLNACSTSMRIRCMSSRSVLGTADWRGVGAGLGNFEVGTTVTDADGAGDGAALTNARADGREEGCLVAPAG